jgi:H+-transporting ATPase
MPDASVHPSRMALEKFAPIPWMLKAAIVLELVLDKYVEAAVIAALLVFNDRTWTVPGAVPRQLLPR